MKKENLNTKTAEKSAQTGNVENVTENQNTNAAPTVETPTTGDKETPPETAQTVPQTEKAAPHTTKAPKAQTIEQQKKLLDTELERLNHKKMLAQHREQFIGSMGSLLLYIDELNKENEFDAKSGRLTFQLLTTENYNRANYTDTFSITNTDLIKEFCFMLNSKMEQKIESLEYQFLNA